MAAAIGMYGLALALWAGPTDADPAAPGGSVQADADDDDVRSIVQVVVHRISQDRDEEPRQVSKVLAVHRQAVAGFLYHVKLLICNPQTEIVTAEVWQRTWEGHAQVLDYTIDELDDRSACRP
ncbi:hypothetical protein GZH49_40070 [Nocardia terpenica]|uniref:hypothetical protein n=1 Tax=Nocardia terpenica TaxID=455432 RepID=UPI002FE31587